MPALITHHLFGEDAATRLPTGLICTDEELLAFLLANQGPDPFFARFSTRPSLAQACHRLASQMHAGHVVEALMVARDAASHLPAEAQGIGRAFVLGLLAHYVLDSRTHPFIYAHIHALEEVDPELAACESEVHAIIESDIDSWMLWSQRGITVADIPTPEHLAHTDALAHIGGAIFAQLAEQVFGISLAVSEYEDAVDDYQLIYALIEPADSKLAQMIVRIEKRLRPYSHAQAMAHQVSMSDDCAFANLACHEWADPHTGATSNLSFGDLYFEALEKWPRFAEALVRGDAEGLHTLSDGRNYSGAPCAI